MKRIVSTLLAVLLLSATLLSLASCGGIAGTYISQTGALTYEFSSKRVVYSDAFTEYDTVYTYEIEKNGSSRYLLLTLEEYTYDGDKQAVKDYVKTLNEELSKTQPKTERYSFIEAADGTYKIGSTTFIKEN